MVNSRNSNDISKELVSNFQCPYCSYQAISQDALESHTTNYCKGAKYGTRTSPEALVAPVTVDTTIPVVSLETLPLATTTPVEPIVEPIATTNGLYMPKSDSYFVIKSSVVAELNRVEERSQKHPINVLVTGQQGCGKTSLGLQYAVRNSRLVADIQCSLMSEASQWWGSMRYSTEKGTYFQESLFVKALETERSVIILDELNRVENPKVINPLFGVLDDRRESWIDDIQRTVKVAPGVVFFATLNEGVLFSGVDFVDTALRDRFIVVQMDLPSQESLVNILVNKTGVKAEFAGILASLAESIRQNTLFDRKISVRQLLLASEEIISGASLHDAVKFAISNSFGDLATEVLQTLQSFVPEQSARVKRDNEEVF